MKEEDFIEKENKFSNKASKNLSKILSITKKTTKKKFSFRWVVVFSVFLSILTSFLVSILVISIFYNLLPQGEKEFVLTRVKNRFNQPSKEEIKTKKNFYSAYSSQELLVIKAVKSNSPSVVSIIVSKDLPIIEQYYINPFEGDEFLKQFFGDIPEFKIPQYRKKGTEKKEIGGGTGFIISSNGLILTNKHVVYDTNAEYTVLTNDGKKYNAKVLARDPVQDLAILKINAQNLPVVKFGNSDNLQIGQTVIAIGNALGEFRNTVSVGVISGLKRTIEAGGTGFGTERISEVIQTDAAINKGNSGGPLLNLKGEVIGINVAIVEGAQNIGFAIPVNRAKKMIQSVKKFGKVIYPFLGVRYVMINKALKEKNKLPVDYGALIIKGPKGESAIFPGSPAEKAGLKEGDIILEINGVKIDEEHYLGDVIQNYNTGDKITIKILRNGKEKIFKVTLAERPKNL